jgi:hypothetical protein
MNLAAAKNGAEIRPFDEELQDLRRSQRRKSSYNQELKGKMDSLVFQKKKPFQRSRRNSISNLRPSSRNSSKKSNKGTHSKPKPNNMSSK